MVYIDDEHEEEVGISDSFVSAGEDGEDEEESPPAGPTEEEEYE